VENRQIEHILNVFFGGYFRRGVNNSPKGTSFIIHHSKSDLLSLISCCLYFFIQEQGTLPLRKAALFSNNLFPG
jgi:hypothetical protein